MTATRQDPAVAIRTTRHSNGVALEIEAAPVNALGNATRRALVEALTANRDAAAILLTCGGRGWFSGADIGELGRALAWPDPLELVQAFETTQAPVLAAIRGPCLGGGLLVALACDRRIASADATFGFPEIKLGLTPAFAGTQYLPRLTGFEAAIDIACSGRQLDARQALDLGLIDRIVAPEAFEREVQADFAMNRAKRRVRDLPVPALPAGLFRGARTAWAESAPGFDAPQRCIDSIELAAHRPFEQALARERELFDACLASEESAILRRLFFDERSATRLQDKGRVTAHLPSRWCEAQLAELSSEESGSSSLADAVRTARRAGQVPVALRAPATDLLRGAIADAVGLPADRGAAIDELRGYGLSPMSARCWLDCGTGAAIAGPILPRVRTALIAAGTSLRDMGLVESTAALRVCCVYGLGWPRYRATPFED